MAILILLLILMTTVAVFAIQNASTVTISFFFWRFESSLAVIIFLSLICGSVMTVLVYTMSKIKASIDKTKASKTQVNTSTEMINKEDEKKQPQ
ncbi:MAG: lipopolysaccharide assembly protein LapA domain-containing protein [Thermodesulfovibrionales bacterium]|nr:lipopolysaccharide assembly protein LapA domain-containing protein [Thermodesulfovibrionales bacterium]